MYLYFLLINKYIYDQIDSVQFSARKKLQLIINIIRGKSNENR